MPIKPYTGRQLQFLRTRYPKMSVADLTAAFNQKFGTDKTEAAIKGTCTRCGFKSGRPKGTPKGSLRSFTREQAEFIKQQYPKRSLKDLVVAFNAEFGTRKTITQLRSFTRNHKVHSGRSGRFEKGCKSWNKGTKGYTSSNRTSFKKGDVPANVRPLGHERVCSKDGHILVKVAEPNPYTGAATRYRAKHQVVWEQHNGPIPEGHLVSFIDGDQSNCSIDNLMLLTRSQQVRLNQEGYYSAPAELKPTILAMVKVKVKAFEMLNQQEA